MIYAQTPEARARLASDLLSQCVEDPELSAAFERMLDEPQMHKGRAFCAGFIKGFVTALHLIDTGVIAATDPQSN